MDKNVYTKIDQFLQGELPDEEKGAFKERLANDEEFAAAYTTSQQMTNYLRASLKQPALEAKMAELGGQYFKEQKTSKAKLVNMSFLRIGLAIAAGLALLLFVWNPFNSGDLYQQFAAHPPLALVEKGAATDVIQEAELAYTNKQYDEAYHFLTKVLEAEPNNVQAKLALGISALETGKMEQAQSIFNDLANGSSILKNYGQWYLALSFIKNGTPEKAKSILESLDNQEPILKEKAVKLLSKLEN
jgi:tetratricopeptide (TPR) repeat protein